MIIAYSFDFVVNSLAEFLKLQALWKDINLYQ
jgi:hypothetical protein